MDKNDIEEFKYYLNRGAVYWHPDSSVFKRVYKVKEVDGKFFAIVGDNKEMLELSEIRHITEFVTLNRMG
jgi:hypothetical protein